MVAPRLSVVTFNERMCFRVVFPTVKKGFPLRVVMVCEEKKWAVMRRNKLVMRMQWRVLFI